MLGNEFELCSGSRKDAGAGTRERSRTPPPEGKAKWD